MNGKVILILFLVVVLGVIIYVFQSGVVGKANDSLRTLFASFPKASYGTSLNTHPSPTAISAPSSNAEPPTTTTIPGTTTTIYLADIPAGFTAQQLSPYFHEVRFDGITPASVYSYGSYGEATLASNLGASSTVDITGWQIKGNDGAEYIPQAIDFYEPSGLSAPGDIILQGDQDVYLYSSKGPFNLRLNECIGYIGVENPTLNPPLPEDCPYQSSPAISSFTGACQNFINSIGTCQTPDLNNSQIPENDAACRNYIENNFNYTSCFNAHEGDANFLSNQWWVWMGASPFDEYHDTAELLDRHGLLVDVYSY